MITSPVLLPTHLNKAKVCFAFRENCLRKYAIAQSHKKMLNVWMILPNIAKKTKIFVKIKCNSFKMKKHNWSIFEQKWIWHFQESGSKVFHFNPNSMYAWYKTPCIVSLMYKFGVIPTDLANEPTVYSTVLSRIKAIMSSLDTYEYTRYSGTS
jgi:hypothetical protein